MSQVYLKLSVGRRGQSILETLGWKATASWNTVETRRPIYCFTFPPTFISKGLPTQAIIVSYIYPNVPHIHLSLSLTLLYFILRQKAMLFLSVAPWTGPMQLWSRTETGMQFQNGHCNKDDKLAQESGFTTFFGSSELKQQEVVGQGWGELAVLCKIQKQEH